MLIFQLYLAINLINGLMKLTLKSKKPEDSNKNIDNSKASSTNNLPSECCQAGKEGERYIFVRPQSKQQTNLHELIRLDSLYNYSKISPRIKPTQLQLTIIKTLSNWKVRYEPWIGYLCAHCCEHVSDLTVRMGRIGEYVEKFRPAFESQKCGGSILRETIKRVQKYCKQSPLNPSEDALKVVCKRYQQTLLLEFIPVEYSSFIIERFLSNDGDIQQYVRLCTSLAHLVLNASNPISQKHFVDLMRKPFMGTVQWPVVIANRHMFDSQPLHVPCLQQP